MHPNGYTVFIVEDQAVRDALGLLLGLRGYPVAMFADAELPALYRPGGGGLLADVRMPGMDGDLASGNLLHDGCPLPVIVMTGHGNVETARDAFRRAGGRLRENRSITSAC